MPLILRGAILADAAKLADVYLRSRNTLASYAPLAHSEAAVRNWVANKLIRRIPSPLLRTMST
jgi:hypothetical protein